MPPPDDLLEEQAERLDDVTLESFTASPPSILPFEASLLRWEVSGLTPGVRILLGGSTVGPSAQRTTQPVTTRDYVLTASSGPAHKTLGRVTVSVDVSACVESELGNPFPLMRGVLDTFIENHPDYYWSAPGPDKLRVELIDDQIDLYMRFRKRLNNAPDLWITLRGRFGLLVENGRLAASITAATGSAKFPTWFELIGGITAFLGLAVNDAKEEATQAARDTIQALVTALNLLVAPGNGMRLHTTRVGTGADGPFIAITVCPDAVLQPFDESLRDLIAVPVT